jgi:hypothetical protein
MIINTNLQTLRRVDDQRYDGMITKRFRPQELEIPIASSKDAMARTATVVMMQLGDYDDSVKHQTTHKVYTKPEPPYVTLSYRIYKVETDAINPKTWDAITTQKGYVEFVTKHLGKDNLYNKLEPRKTTLLKTDVEWRGSTTDIQYGYVYVAPEKLTTVMRMSSRGGGFLFTNQKDDTTEVLMLPRTDTIADAGKKADALGKLSYGVAPTRLGFAIRTLKANTEQARLALNPELVNLVGQETMLCTNSDDNKYLVKGLDNGISQREVAQLFLDTIKWSVKPLNPTKGIDK